MMRYIKMILQSVAVFILVVAVVQATSGDTVEVLMLCLFPFIWICTSLIIFAIRDTHANQSNDWEDEWEKNQKKLGEDKQE